MFESVRGVVRACIGGRAAKVSVAASVSGATGRPTQASVAGGGLGEQEIRCVANAIRGLSFPVFASTTRILTHSYEFR